MTDNDTYAVDLTFKQWMDITQALGYSATGYRENGMEGTANKMNAIKDEIADQLQNHD